MDELGSRHVVVVYLYSDIHRETHHGVLQLWTGVCSEDVKRAHRREL